MRPSTIVYLSQELRNRECLPPWTEVEPIYIDVLDTRCTATCRDAFVEVLKYGIVIALEADRYDWLARLSQRLHLENIHSTHYN